jgi:predicted nucleic acid-binding protein
MIGYLLDTNALSESPKSQPNPGFIEWLKAVDQRSLYTSCIVLGEIQKGIGLQVSVLKRMHLESLLAEIIDDFDGRILDVMKDDCLLWGDLFSRGMQVGKTPPAIDSLLAAQCIRNKLTLVTRNIKDFEQFDGLDIFCPWTN